jgi:hypothetical protein
MTDNFEIQEMFDLYRTQIKNIKSENDITPELLAGMWSMSIYASLIHLRATQPHIENEVELLELARMMALKHFDVSLLDSFGIDTGEDDEDFEEEDEDEEDEELEDIL